MWWHGVQSLGPFNVLMNYWWNRDEVSARHPYGALLHLAFALYRRHAARAAQGVARALRSLCFQIGGDPMDAFPPAQRLLSAKRSTRKQVEKFKALPRELLAE